MATLTEVSSIARNIIRWGTVALIVIALIPGAISLSKRIYLTFNPPPPPPPTVKYGKLPKLIFPETQNYATPEYKLETISGGLPALPDTSKVYLVGINKSRLLVLERMNQKVSTVWLKDEPIQLDDRKYRYVSSKGPIDMIFDVITESFSYRYDWTTDPGFYTTTDVPVGKTAEAEAKNFLGRLGGIEEDIANGTAKTLYLIASGSAMVPAISPYDANFVRVDIFRAEKNEVLPTGQKLTMQIVTAGADTSPVHVIISSLGSEKKIVQANYYYSQIMDGDQATYPLKSVDTAWKELVSGTGFIAKRTTEKTVTVRRVSLAYYESNEQQDFLQPVYVFEGDGGFTAYVQAVDSGFIVN